MSKTARFRITAYLTNLVGRKSLKNIIYTLSQEQRLKFEDYLSDYDIEFDCSKVYDVWIDTRVEEYEGDPIELKWVCSSFKMYVLNLPPTESEIRANGVSSAVPPFHITHIQEL